MLTMMLAKSSEGPRRDLRVKKWSEGNVLAFADQSEEREADQDRGDKR